jgi:hypothetical protein
MVSSLDGFIAKQDNSVSWLDDDGSVYEVGVSISEKEAVTFVKAIDCYVLGSRTHEHALELVWPYGDTPAHEVLWFSAVPQDPFIFIGVCEFLGGVGQQARVER